MNHHDRRRPLPIPARCFAALLAFGVAAGCAAGPAAKASPADAPPSVIVGPGEDTPSLMVIAAPGGDVSLATRKDKELMYDRYTYAAARRAGDYVFLSGVIAGPLPGEGRDVAALKAQLARAFTTIRRNLEAAGATMAQVVDVQTYHVFDSPGFHGSAGEQMQATLEVKKEFLPEPYPAWTLVGVTALADPDAVVEIKVTAYSPRSSTR